MDSRSGNLICHSFSGSVSALIRFWVKLDGFPLFLKLIVLQRAFALLAPDCFVRYIHRWHLLFPHFSRQDRSLIHYQTLIDSLGLFLTDTFDF